MAENFARRLEDSSRRAPEKPALVWDGGALTFGELDRRASAFAAALAALGVKAGDSIALTIGNDWTFAVALIAGWKLGAAVAPLDTLLKDEERADIVADLAPRLLVRETDIAGPGRGGPGGLGRQSGTPESRPQPERLRSGLWVTEPAEPARPAPPRSSDATPAALILYTSGSTGRPKGALLSHAALELAIESWAGPVMALVPGDVVLATLPLAHSFGLNGALLAPLLVGATVALVERFAPDRVLEAIQRHRVTVFPGVATMFRRLLDARELAAANLGSVRIAVSGAAPCPWELAERWRDRTGIRIVRGYGMTELFRPISY
ncbi:MAG: class I adenylate-forming enzyme family protein, partial [Candidatus Rokuibacteriota bacterium]